MKLAAGFVWFVGCNRNARRGIAGLGGALVREVFSVRVDELFEAAFAAR